MSSVKDFAGRDAQMAAQPNMTDYTDPPVTYDTGIKKHTTNINRNSHRHTLKSLNKQRFIQSAK